MRIVRVRNAGLSVWTRKSKTIAPIAFFLQKKCHTGVSVLLQDNPDLDLDSRIYLRILLHRKIGKNMRFIRKTCSMSTTSYVHRRERGSVISDCLVYFDSILMSVFKHASLNSYQIMSVFPLGSLM